MSVLDGHRIVPLATPEDAGEADVLAEGLVRGGISVLEVALRGDWAMQGLTRIAARGDVVVGAGTVLSVAQAQEALDAGASFLVAPGLDEAVVRFAQDAGVPIVPGVMTPTEVQTARSFGLTQLKLFPAGLLGGTKALDTLGAVYRDIRFMPSGGVQRANLAAHLTHPAVFAVSGTWMTNAAMIAQGVDAIANSAAEARSAATA